MNKLEDLHVFFSGSVHITFGVMVERCKNSVIHVYPNCTSPIWSVMLCVVFHVHGTVKYNFRFTRIIIYAKQGHSS